MLEFKFVKGILGYELTKTLREEIFKDELNIQKTTDELDEESYHFVGYDKLAQISVARLSKLSEKIYKISFVGIKKDYRRQLVGDLIMRALADKARTLGATTILVDAPKELIGFFEFEGYTKTETKFTKDNKEYIVMEKDATVIQKCGGCQG